MRSIDGPTAGLPPLALHAMTSAMNHAAVLSPGVISFDFLPSLSWAYSFMPGCSMEDLRNKFLHGFRAASHLSRPHQQHHQSDSAAASVALHRAPILFR